MNISSPEWKPQPPARKGDPISLHTLPSRDFERLCGELFAIEPGVESCELYGVGGQEQYGIDLLARETDAIHVQVGQCKCYESFTVKDIKDASTKFWDHWETRWKHRSVTRFILFLACEVEKTQHQDEIDNQRETFRRVGLKYDVWPASRIVRTLRPNPGIVSLFFEPVDYWLERICSQTINAPRSQIAAVTFQNEQLSTVLAGTVGTIAAQIDEAWREGRRRDARRLLANAVGSESSFRVLPNELQARLIRFEAISALEMGEPIARVEALAKRATLIEPASPGTSLLAALIQLHRQRPAEALAELQDINNIEALQLKASILLMLGRLDEANGELSAIEESATNAETYRLRALLNVSKGNVDAARLDVQKALALRPKWAAVQFLGAVVDYFSSLALPPLFIPYWPEPVDWTLVRRDDETLDRLAKAGSILAEHLLNPDLTGVERDHLEIWRLACLANDPARQEEAGHYSATLLKDRPTRPEPIAWALARDFDLSFESSEAVLRDIVLNGQGSSNQVISLVGIYCHNEQFTKAEQILDHQRGQFTGPTESLWIHWKAQVLGLQERLTEAQELIDSSTSPEEFLSLRTSLLRRRPENRDALRDFVARLESLYRQTGNPRNLLLACEGAAALEDWVYVADRADELLSAMGTADLVRPLAFATYNASRAEACLRLLDSAGRLFPSGKLPTALRRLRIDCQRRIGAIPAAVSEAEALAWDEPTFEHRLALSQVYFSKGDFRHFCLLARELLRSEELLQGDIALRLAWQSQWDDRRLAQDLWRVALRHGIADEAVVPALQLGYALGLDEQLLPLTVRMQFLAKSGKAGVQIVTIQELIERVRQSQTRAEEMNQLYDHAQIPIHLIAPQLKLTLAEIYHDEIERSLSSTNLSRCAHVLARFGGKSLPAKRNPVAAPERLSLDVTAVLLAADLGILSLVEAKYKPIRLPPSIIASLVRMRDELTRTQPQRLAAFQVVVGLREENRLKTIDPTAITPSAAQGLPEALGPEWRGLLSAAEQAKGYLVDFLPIPTGDTFIPVTSLPPEAIARMTNCRTVIESLHQHGPLASHQRQEALQRIGTEAASTLSNMPSPGDELFFDGTTIELLATSGVLPIISDRFKCHITVQESSRLDYDLRIGEQRQRLAEWVKTLMERLSLGMDDGTYELIQDNAGRDEERIENNPDVACLVSLTRLPEGNVVWIDDRWANRQLQAGSARIIDVIDVLRGLWADQALSESEYYKILSRLRGGNVWFIPTDKAEILYHLKIAHFSEGTVVETTDLQALRRGLASCLLRADILQKPTDQQLHVGEFGEGSFLLSWNHAVSEALAEIWKTEPELQGRVARSEWLLRNLYVDQHILRRLSGFQSTTAEDLSLTAGRFAGLLSIIFSMPLSDSERHRTREYADWLTRRVLGGPLVQEPGLDVRTADIIKRIFLDVAPKTLRTTRAKVALSIMQSYLEALPDPIKSQLFRDPDLAARFRLRTRAVGEVAGIEFEREVFAHAAADAVNGRISTVQDMSGTRTITFSPGETDVGQCEVRVEDPSAGFKAVVNDLALGVLSESPIVRERSLRGQRATFDMTADAFERFVAEVASTESPGRRLEKVDEARTNSGAYYYRQLQEQLSKREDFNPQDLMPNDPELLIRHFRLDGYLTVDPISNALSSAATVLLESEPLETVIPRLAGFPIPMPSVVLNQVAGLPSDRKEDLVTKVIGITSTPLSIWHTIAVLRACNEPGFTRLGQIIARKSLSASQDQEFDAFRSVLRWATQEFRTWPKAKSLSRAIRLSLAWAHAHQVFVTFKALASPMDWIHTTFEDLTRRVRLGSLQSELDLRADVNHPRYLNRNVLLLCGLDYALAPSDERPLPTQLSEAFWNVAMMPTEFGPFPDIPLLLDSQMAGNQLGGFLGGDRHAKLLSVVPRGDIERIGAILAEASTEKTLAALEEHFQEVAWWSRLYTVNGGVGLPPEMRDRLGQVILRTDFVAMTTRDHATGHIALHMASVQSQRMANELVRTHLTQALVGTAGILAKQTRDKQSRDLAFVLLDCAINIAQCEPPDGRVMDEFARIAEMLVWTWDFVGDVAKDGIQRLCEEVPLAESNQLWRLNLRLRCRT